MTATDRNRDENGEGSSGPEVELAWLDIADDAECWQAAGFVVEGAAVGTARCLVAGVELRLLGRRDEARGVIGWGFAGPGVDVAWTEIDGIPTATAVTHHPPPPPQHPNGVFRIDHLVVRTTSTPRTVDALTGIGLERRGHRTTNSAGDAVDMTFFWAGDTLLEVAGPPAPEAPAPSRLSGIAFATHDLDAAAALLGPRLTTPREAVQPGRRIAALTADAGCTTRVALMTPHERSRDADGRR